MVLYCIYHIERVNSLCFQTAVVPLGDGELHLVAMTSRRNLTNHACFWGYKLPFGLYNSCLTMLNLRCLGIVFDLDEEMDFPCTLVTRSECHKVEVPRVLEQSKSS